MVVMAGKQELKVDPLVSVSDVAKWLGVHRNTVFNMISRGEISAFRVGLLIKVPHSSVLAYLEAQKVVSEE